MNSFQNYINHSDSRNVANLSLHLTMSVANVQTLIAKTFHALYSQLNYSHSFPIQLVRRKNWLTASSRELLLSHCGCFPDHCTLIWRTVCHPKRKSRSNEFIHEHNPSSDVYFLEKIFEMLPNIFTMKTMKVLLNCYVISVLL